MAFLCVKSVVYAPPFFLLARLFVDHTVATIFGEYPLTRRELDMLAKIAADLHRAQCLLDQMIIIAIGEHAAEDAVNTSLAQSPGGDDDQQRSL